MAPVFTADSGSNNHQNILIYCIIGYLVTVVILNAMYGTMERRRKAIEKDDEKPFKSVKVCDPQRIEIVRPTDLFPPPLTPPPPPPQPPAPPLPDKIENIPADSVTLPYVSSENTLSPIDEDYETAEESVRKDENSSTDSKNDDDNDCSEEMNIYIRSERVA